MHYRTLGKTDLSVSEIGYGTWGIGKSGWIGAKDTDSLVALHRAIDLGLNFIDTALAYGEGHSEQLIGQIEGVRRTVRTRLLPCTLHVGASTGPAPNREHPPT